MFYLVAKKRDKQIGRKAEVRQNYSSNWTILY